MGDDVYTLERRGQYYSVLPLRARPRVRKLGADGKTTTVADVGSGD